MEFQVLFLVSFFVVIIVLVAAMLRCGIKHKLELDGSHLFDQSNERIILSEDIAYGYEKKALFQDNWKLLHSEGDRATMLFDLACDPGEKHNLAKTNVVKLEKLLAALSKAKLKGEPLKIDKEIKKQLQDLGYL